MDLFNGSTISINSKKHGLNWPKSQLALTLIPTFMWKESNNRLRATFKFLDFKAAFAFMTEVAFYAEQHQHHPDWSNVYNTVQIDLNTHDAGGIVTEKDHALAKDIDKVYEKYKQRTGDSLKIT